mgnify:CR=1 FL=1
MPADDRALIDKYLEFVRVEKRLAARTVELYALDLARLHEQAERAGVGLREVQNHHIRRWVAQISQRKTLEGWHQGAPPLPMRGSSRA